MALAQRISSGTSFRVLELSGNAIGFEAYAALNERALHLAFCALHFGCPHGRSCRLRSIH
jgi:hypothetical protein